MEIIEIRSVHSLLTQLTHARPLGTHSYRMNCRHYLSTYKAWKAQTRPKVESFAVMSLDFKRIWLTGTEGEKIAQAIDASRSPIDLAGQSDFSERIETYE